MKTFLLLSSALAASILAAAPTVRTGSVVVDQSAGRSVTVSYELQNEPAVVTVDFLTNGVSVGESNCTRLSGDVNKLVEVGERSLLWVPDREWAMVLPDVDFTAKVTVWATNSPPEIMVVDLCAGNTVRYYTSTNALPHGGLANDIYRSEKMVFRKIPAARVQWRMGSDSTVEGDSQRVANNEVPHLVTLTEDFYMAIFELTIDQYLMLTQSGDGSYGSGNVAGSFKPIVNVSWATIRGSVFNWPTNGHKVDSGCFVGRLRALTGMDTIDLPTDAQWEFACRAGFGSPSGTDDTRYQIQLWDALVTNRAWYVSTPGVESSRHKVGMLQPNRWGLYDMQGNVYEYCLDYWSSGDDFSDGSPATDPTGPATPVNGNRVVRNGSYGAALDRMRPAFRFNGGFSAEHSHMGFRLAAGAYAR